MSKNMQRKKYVKVSDRRQGLTTKDRTTTKAKKNSNQWVSDPRHDLFAVYWLSPNSDTFGNAYQSAIQAGYSPHHAKQITSGALSLEWVKEARSRMINYNPQHISKLLEKHATSGKDADRLKAIDMLAKINGMYIDRSIQQVDVNFTNTIPRPKIIDIEQ